MLRLLLLKLIDKLLPTSGCENDPLGEPTTEIVSPWTTPIRVGVPENVAVVVASYTLLFAEIPPISNGAGIITPLVPDMVPLNA